MRWQLPVAHLGALVLQTLMVYSTLFAGAVRMFLWGQQPWKHHCVNRLWTIVLSQDFWLMWRVAEVQFQQCYQEQTEEDKGPWAQQGPHQWVPMPSGFDSSAGLIVSDVGYAFVYLHVCVHVCISAPVCPSAHSWDGGNCVSVFTPWLKISLPLHLTADWFDLADTIHLFYQLPQKKNLHHTTFHS